MAVLHTAKPQAAYNKTLIKAAGLDADTSYLAPPEGCVSTSEFPIVGIGASAGGIEAFHGFFEHLPANSGMAFVVILHLPPDRKSMLREILMRWTSMPVIQASERTYLEPDHIYLPSPHAMVRFSDGHLHVEMHSDDSERVFRPIDVLFDSLASALGERAIGIVLSGTGTDGALGLKAIKERGGLTVAQGIDGSAPWYGEMPAGAIATGSVDIVAPVEKIPEYLLKLRRSTVALSEAEAPTLDSMRLEICDILRRQLGHDFRDYRGQTFLRRVERRMQVTNSATLANYIDKLRDNTDEVTHLFRDLLIRVTSFFRDQKTFETFGLKVIPHLFEGKTADGTVRVWIPGCATGEEAYSLAILLREHLDSLSAAPKVQVFATDIDETAITTARHGRYPMTLLEGLSEQRRERFFTFSHGGYSISKEIRELCTFSIHNLIRDPPFSMMSLVSCRNLLIYMNPKLQSRVIPIFHYSLIPGGILLLGGSESAAHHADLFETIDKGARIFQRRDGRSPELNLDWRDSRLRLHSAAGNPTTMTPLTWGETRDTSPTVAQPAFDDDVLSARLQHLLADEPAEVSMVGPLREAVKSLREELRSLREEHQTALEELRSTNEELHSVNEEMQSTNEELETSKEELQSLNEELHTVNIRLTEKVDELDHTNSDLRNLFDSTQIATVFLDRYLIIRNFTPAVATLYNLIPSDQGRPITHIVSRLRYNGLREDVAQVLSTLEPLERRVVRDDGSAHYILRVLPYREPDSTVSGALLTFVDVSNIVQAEEALVEADVRKDVFLATLSHELRNPLAPIRIAAQLLQTPNVKPDELVKAQAIIARQVAHMSALLDDLLDVSRITRGAFLLKRDYVDLQVLLDGAVEAVRPTMDAKRHTFRVEPPPSPIYLEVDPVRVTQVLTNLLTNAAKYTPPCGIISMRTQLEAQHVAISVRDNGIGLSPEAIDKVFDMFTRFESDSNGSEGGLGIGLALAKGLMELHGGQIRVHSAGRGQGSEFAVYLPRSLIVDSVGQRSETPGDASSGPFPRRIVIADDNVDGAETLRILLESSGHEVHVAHTGAEALAIAKRIHPEVALLDIGLPDMSGYQIAESIRHEAWGKDMTLIAVTGWGQESDKRRALAAGFDQHLTKPIDPARLKALM